jgi:hypothetical protein
MRYGIEIRVHDQDANYYWSRMHPAGGAPYVWDTREEAGQMLRMCYPQHPITDARIVELP